MKRIHAAMPRIVAATSLLLLLLADGCGEVVSPGKNLQYKNEVDIFRFQVSDMSNYSQTYGFTWITSASNGVVVDQWSNISGGDATLVLKDASGTTVYSRSMKQIGRFTSAAGVPGNWTVQILMNKVSGSLILQAEPN